MDRINFDNSLRKTNLIMFVLAATCDGKIE